MSEPYAKYQSGTEAVGSKPHIMSGGGNEYEKVY